MTAFPSPPSHNAFRREPAQTEGNSIRMSKRALKYGALRTPVRISPTVPSTSSAVPLSPRTPGTPSLSTQDRNCSRPGLHSTELTDEHITPPRHQPNHLPGPLPGQNINLDPFSFDGDELVLDDGAEEIDVEGDGSGEAGRVIGGTSQATPRRMPTLDIEAKKRLLTEASMTTEMRTRAWKKMKALPGFDLPKDTFRSGYQVSAHLGRCAGVEVDEIDCCINDCRLFHGAFAEDDECLCTAPRYKADGVTPQKTWPYVRFSNRLKALWADRVTAREMRHRVDRVEDPDILQDVFDGGCYKDLLQRDVTWKGRVVEPATRYFDRDTDVALGFASDGILMVQRGSDSCWPVILTVFNLPPELRTKREFQICCGLIPGSTDVKVKTLVDLSSYLGPFLAELRELSCNGIEAQLWDGETFTLRAHLLSISGDMPAQAKFMEFKSHSGKLPCRFCKLVSTPHEGSGQYYPALTPNGIVKYQYNSLPMRNDRQIKQTVKEIRRCTTKTAQEALKTREGISGDSVFHAVGSILFPWSFPPDITHVFFENIMKQLLTAWEGKYKTGTQEERAGDGFVIAEEAWASMSRDILLSNTTVPTQLARTFNAPLETRGTWTAETYAYFLLFLGPIVLANRLPDLYYAHFLKLSAMARRITKTALTRKEIADLQTGLGDWVVDFERLYHQHKNSRLHYCTSPIHALLHLAEVTERQGPLSYTWCFAMERYGGWLKRELYNRKDIIRTLSNRVVKQEQIHLLLSTLPSTHRNRWKQWDCYETNIPDTNGQHADPQIFSDLATFQGALYDQTDFEPTPAIWKALLNHFNSRNVDNPAGLPGNHMMTMEDVRKLEWQGYSAYQTSAERARQKFRTPSNNRDSTRDASWAMVRHFRAESVYSS